MQRDSTIVIQFLDLSGDPPLSAVLVRHRCGCFYDVKTYVATRLRGNLSSNYDNVLCVTKPRDSDANLRFLLRYPASWSSKRVGSSVLLIPGQHRNITPQGCRADTRVFYGQRRPSGAEYGLLTLGRHHAEENARQSSVFFTVNFDRIDIHLTQRIHTEFVRVVGCDWRGCRRVTGALTNDGSRCEEPHSPSHDVHGSGLPYDYSEKSDFHS